MRTGGEEYRGYYSGRRSREGDELTGLQKDSQPSQTLEKVRSPRSKRVDHCLWVRTLGRREPILGDSVVRGMGGSKEEVKSNCGEEGSEE